MSRQKLVFSDINDVAHLWANQKQSEARNSGNFYFKHRTIYSYGSHFPIATIYTTKSGNDVCLMTERGYSITTTKHIEAVQRANYLPVITMPYVLQISNSYEADKAPGFWHIKKNQPEGLHEKNLKYWELEVEALLPKLGRARKPEIYISQINAINDSVRKYVEFWGIKLTKLQQKIFSGNQELMLQFSKEKAEAIRKAEAKTIKQNREYIAKQIKEFYTFENNTIDTWRTNEYEDDRAFIRFNTEKQRFETSKRIECPLETAKRFWRWLKAIRKKGGCDGVSCGEYKILDYEIRQVTNEYLHVGCHKIYFTDIEQYIPLLES